MVGDDKSETMAMAEGSLTNSDNESIKQVSLSQRDENEDSDGTEDPEEELGGENGEDNQEDA